MDSINRRYVDNYQSGLYPFDIVDKCGCEYHSKKQIIHNCICHVYCKITLR